MIAKRIAGAFLGLIVSLTASTAWADDPPVAVFTWGVFRENVQGVHDSQKNCWSQAMITGQTINGEVLNSGLTEAQAAARLSDHARRGQCASARTATSWATRCDVREGSLNYERETRSCNPAAR